jgi:hypothetical protein
MEPLERRWMRALAVAGWTLAAGAVAVPFLVARGEARGHALFHLVFGVVAISGLTAIASRSRSRIARGGSHTFLAAALGFLAPTSLLESVAGPGTTGSTTAVGSTP